MASDSTKTLEQLIAELQDARREISKLKEANAGAFQRQEALEQSVERLSLALEAVNDAVWDWWIDTGEVLFSARWYTMLGYEPNELPQEFETWRKLLHPDDRERSERVISRHVETSRPFEIEFRMRTRDGAWKWILGRGKVVEWDERGNARRMLGTHVDITERKRAESALLESERRFRDLFENAAAGVALHDMIYDDFGLPVDYVITDANRAYQRITGLDYESTVGRKASELYGTGKAPYLEMYSSVANGGPAQQFDTYFEPMDRHFSIVAYGYRKGSFATVFEDITEHKRAEETLVKSERELAKYQARLALAMDIARIGAWEMDLGTRIFTFDDHFYALYGTTAEREGGQYMSGETYAREFVHPEDAWVVADEVEKALSSDDPDYSSQIEHRVVRRDGELRHIAVRFRLIRDENGRPVKTIGVNQDITERRRAEEELSKSNERYRILVETATEGVVAIDTEEVITFANKALAEMLGCDFSEIVGQKISSFLFPTELKSQNEIMRERKSGKDSIYERRWRRKDGGEVWTIVSGKALTDDQGHFIGAFGMLTDITERKRTEEMLKQALDISRATTSQLTAMYEAARTILTVDDFPTVARAIFDSASELIGSTAGYVALLSEDELENEVLFLEAGGRPCAVNPELPMPIRGLRAETYRTNSVVYDNDFMNSRWLDYLPKGHVRLDNVLFSPLVVDGKTMGIMGLANKPGGFTDEDAETGKAFGDLAAIALRNSNVLEKLKTSEKNYREAAEASEAATRSKSEFLANMSHEIRTPLNGVLGMLQLAMLTNLDKEQREYIEVAIKSSRSLLTVINDVLDFSKIEAGKLEIGKEPVNLPDVISSVIEVFRYQALRKGVELRMDIGDLVPETVIGDEGRLRQILFNIIGNSLKFTDKGEIALKVRSQEEGDNGVRLRFEISDTGIGIPEEKIDKIFEAFTQVDGTLTRKHSGCGLGLAIVKRLVDLMHGEVKISSRLGEGTAVRFNILLGAERRRSERKKETSQQISPIGNRKHRLLLVEDEDINRVTTTLFLKKMGYKVEIAVNGREALEKCSVDAYDCVLMDIQMPEMDGIEAAKRIREGLSGKTHKDVPILALTAYAMSGDRERFLKAGMDDYLAKPVDMLELQKILGRLIDSKD